MQYKIKIKSFIIYNKNYKYKRMKSHDAITVISGNVSCAIMKYLHINYLEKLLKHKLYFRGIKSCYIYFFNYITMTNFYRKRLNDYKILLRFNNVLYIFDYSIVSKRFQFLTF